jgi:hypothetical protein
MQCTMLRYDGRDRERGWEKGGEEREGRRTRTAEARRPTRRHYPNSRIRSKRGRKRTERMKEKRIEINKSWQEDGIKLHEGGDLRPAKMNKGEEQWKQEAIRGDAIKWLDRTDTELRARFPALWAILDAQDSLRAELDAACEFKSIKKTQVQVRKRFFPTRYKEKQRYIYFRYPASLPPLPLSPGTY